MNVWSRRPELSPALRAGWWRAILTAVVTVLIAGPLSASEEINRYFEQLRRRGLFAVAESYALARLSDPQVTPAWRQAYVIELSQTLAEHAVAVGPKQQAELWEQARRVLQEELERDPPQREVLAAQAVFVSSSRAEWLCRTAEWSPLDGPLRDTAVQSATTALDELHRFLTTAEGRFRQTGERRSVDVSLHELRRLVQSAWQRSGDLSRRRAVLQAEAAERASDLEDAEQSYRRAMTAISDVQRGLMAKVGLAECARLKGDRGRARDMLAAIVKSTETLTPEIASAVDACRVQCWLDERKPIEALEHLLAIRQGQPALSGELWVLQMQALILMQEVSPASDELRQRIQAEAEIVLKRVDEYAGGVWSRTCRLMWDRAGNRQRYGRELDELVQRAKSEYASGRQADAATLYARAASLARGNQQVDLDVEFSYTQGSILLEQQTFTEAATVFSDLVQRSPQHERAPAADLLAAYALGRRYTIEPTEPHLEAYAAALTAHAQKYPQSETSGEARLLSGQLAENQQRFNEALACYREIPLVHSRGLDAASGLARCGEQQVLQHKLRGDDWQPLRTTVMSQLAALIDQWPADRELAMQRGEVALRLARLAALAEPPAPDEIRRWLTLIEAAYSRQPEKPAPEWTALKQQTLPLQLLVLAGSSRGAEARQLLQENSASDPQEMWAIADGLGQMLSSTDTQQYGLLPELFADAVERLASRAEQLTGPRQAQLGVMRVRARLLLGDTPAAVQQAEAQIPKAKAETLQQLAELLLVSRRPPAMKVARGCWRKLEAKVPAGTAEWLKIRAALIECSLELDDRVEAERLLRIVDALYPLPEDEELQRRFGELRVRLGIPEVTQP